MDNASVIFGHRAIVAHVRALETFPGSLFVDPVLQQPGRPTDPITRGPQN